MATEMDLLEEEKSAMKEGDYKIAGDALVAKKDSAIADLKKEYAILIASGEGLKRTIDTDYAGL